jgi:hypothetical protein
MHGQTDTTSALTATFSGGGYDGWCGGSGLCNAPLEFVATTIRAPELNAGRAATCIELLLASLLIFSGRRRPGSLQWPPAASLATRWQAFRHGYTPLNPRKYCL